MILYRFKKKSQCTECPDTCGACTVECVFSGESELLLNNNNNNNKSGFKEPSSHQTPLKTVQRRKEKGKEMR